MIGTNYYINFERIYMGFTYSILYVFYTVHKMSVKEKLVKTHKQATIFYMIMQKRVEILIRKKYFYFYMYKKNFIFDLQQISSISANFTILVKEKLVKIHKQAMIFHMIMQKKLRILIQKKIFYFYIHKKNFTFDLRQISNHYYN
jgi:hypothetical protein